MGLGVRAGILGVLGSEAGGSEEPPGLLPAKVMGFGVFMDQVVT